MRDDSVVLCLLDMCFVSGNLIKVFSVMYSNNSLRVNGVRLNFVMNDGMCDFYVLISVLFRKNMVVIVC